MPAEAMPSGAPVAEAEAPTLPWFRNPDELPATLPTVAEIEAATSEFSSVFDSSARRTVLVNEVFVVKHGPFVFENEGHALLFLESLPEVPAPRLHAMYRQNEKLYIVMEYMQGDQLSTMWPSLSESEKSPIVEQLRQISNCLRAIPSPGVFGGVYGGPYAHRHFLSLTKDPRVTGPFYNAEDVCRALALRSKNNWEMVGRHSWMTGFFDRQLATVLRGGNSVFTHSDFQRKNILVRERPSPSAIAESGAERCFEVVAILDWEDAGWYPRYWAYSSCFAYFDWCDDWAEKVEQILDPWPSEAALLRMVAQDLDA